MLGGYGIEQLAPLEDIVARLPRGLDADETARLQHLITDAVELLEVEFADSGRDLAVELDVDYNTRVQPLHSKVRWAVREMVSAAVLIGPNAGMRSVSSSTGPESDSVTFADVGSVSFGGVALTDRIRRRFGLSSGDRPKGRFPPPLRWPEVINDVHPGC